ncbi:Polyketide cyclase / dehydrase and lipid transport [Streptomyces sp. 2224.1]|uniref:SRPBCC family protein n=1 Tax=unclassified Streptomyces TaxID=2593676 RepID=UPI000880047C|nr:MULTISPECIES: SRPBCC family protein [unclassified Streptomyces]PBC81062.1 polyketide cyclase/dehydrase/lipid transport protein [Streptomyces sp. 2321.6]SDR56510.1 Polyketide cyclase / dehydrase and lipid transport [Streptomyces sp. KS_16]SEB99661.1 Polyketide cyclase / dehydrase and lipid transport [Streptomyces sp. 2133.1]SED27901.1 Polyketide cyclase / dehydrase and lipid transport [Streptomyces sp. 2224.1]SEF10763.1 Polyketide cyclase / dehydrase and lipid transport [Streptomyces sp. 211
MAKTGRDNADSGIDRLRSELGDYATKWVGNLAERAGDKLMDVTDQLTDVAENGGSLSKIAGNLLGGDSPVKAAMKGTAANVKDTVVDKAKGLFGSKKRKSGDKKVTNIIEVLDIGVPLRFAYDHWTQYEKFSGFTKGVRNVSLHDETTSDWKAKVAFSTRGWKATVQEQVPDERIIWTSEGAKGSTRGAVSFHELGPNLTRIVLVVEYYASGFFEKTANIWRAQGRRLRLDFKHFQRYVTLTDEEPEGWRGEIRDGEVVRSHEEAIEEEEAEGEETEDEEAEGYEDEDGEEEYEDEEAEGEEGDEEEEEEPDEEYEDEDNLDEEEEDEGEEEE